MKQKRAACYVIRGGLCLGSRQCMQFFSRASSQNGGDGSVLRRDFRGADTEQESAAGSRRRPNFGSSNPWYYKTQYPIDGYMYVSV